MRPPQPGDGLERTTAGQGMSQRKATGETTALFVCLFVFFFTQIAHFGRLNEIKSHYMVNG